MACSAPLNLKNHSETLLENSIKLSFGWQGPTQKLNGKVSVGIVDLFFKDSLKTISVHIRDGSSPQELLNKLRFTVRKPGDIFFEERTSGLLNVTIEKLKDLTLKVGVFEEYQNHNQLTMDAFGQITGERRLRRTDDTIKLEFSQNLEIGQEYRIVFNSNSDLQLKASLVKVPTSKKEQKLETTSTSIPAAPPSHLLAYQEELNRILEPLIMPVYQRQSFAFVIRNQITKGGSTLVGDPGRSEETNQAMAKALDEAFYRGINAIDYNSLQNLLISVRELQTKWTIKTELDKQVVRLCIPYLPAKTLEDIMRSGLMTLVFGEITPTTQKLINEIGASFPSKFMNHWS